MDEMQDQSDAQLLRAYAESGHEPAFREIVVRHADLVYSAALRQVESSDLACDVAQSVFTDLARKARPLADKLTEGSSLVGWLYRSTRFAALNQLRDDRRRLAHERLAMEQLITDTEAAPDWERVRPVLDEAMADLSDEDREALLLRYFKNHDFRAVGRALGVSNDAAQKRVSRAVDRLREFFAKRGVTVGASGLAVVISANAIQAAPVGLALNISTAAVLAGSTIATTTTIAAAMTTLQKTLVTATVAVLAGAGIYEAHQASQLREQNGTLQQQQATLVEQIQQLHRERDDATNEVTSLAGELTKFKANDLELAKLRNEVAVLRRNLTAGATRAQAIAAAEAARDNYSALAAVGQELGMAIVRGDAGAFDKLLAESKAEHQSFKTNNVGLDDTRRSELASRTFIPINAAFKIISDAAGQGNQLALDALTRALETSELKGLAAHSIGGLAGNGDAGALEVLLHPQKYGILLSSTISALQPAADNGNQEAIEALAAVAKSQKDQPLWVMTANSLAKAAAAGNPAAIEGLVSISSSTNQYIQAAAVRALKGAAANRNQKATEALRAMGVQ
jgi:RNA polymerase sigma factor (sigma-70 family)